MQKLALAPAPYKILLESHLESSSRHKRPDWSTTCQEEFDMIRRVRSAKQTCMSDQTQPFKIGIDWSAIGQKCLSHENWEGQGHEERVPVEDASSVICPQVDLCKHSMDMDM
jgi:hypothetical protein